MRGRCPIRDVVLRTSSGAGWRKFYTGKRVLLKRWYKICVFLDYLNSKSDNFTSFAQFAGVAVRSLRRQTIRSVTESDTPTLTPKSSSRKIHKQALRDLYTSGMPSGLCNYIWTLLEKAIPSWTGHGLGDSKLPTPFRTIRAELHRPSSLRSFLSLRETECMGLTLTLHTTLNLSRNLAL